MPLKAIGTMSLSHWGIYPVEILGGITTVKVPRGFTLVAIEQVVSAPLAMVALGISSKPVEWSRVGDLTSWDPDPSTGSMKAEDIAPEGL